MLEREHNYDGKTRNTATFQTERNPMPRNIGNKEGPPDDQRGYSDENEGRVITGRNNNPWNLRGELRHEYYMTYNNNDKRKGLLLPSKLPLMPSRPQRSIVGNSG